MVSMTTPTRRFLRRNFGVFFRPAARYPADPRAVFILALSVFSGLTVLALGAAPRSLDELLPEWGVTLWSLGLTIGSGVTLWGIARQTINGILLEQVGSVMVAVTTIYYSTLAILIVGWDALQSISIIAAWGLACGIRWIQLQALIAHGASEAEEERVDGK